MNTEPRKPRAFRLDDPNVVMADTPVAAAMRRGHVVVTPEPEAFEQEAAEVAPQRPRRSRWGTLFWSAVGGLVSLAIGLSLTKLIDDLFSYAGWLGWLGAALTGLGFSLVFPALAVEAVSLVPAPNRGAALGAYSVFADLSLGATGPIAGFIIGSFGYAAIYFSAAIGVALALGLAVFLHRRNRPAGATAP